MHSVNFIERLSGSCQTSFVQIQQLRCVVAEVAFDLVQNLGWTHHQSEREIGLIDLGSILRVRSHLRDTQKHGTIVDLVKESNECVFESHGDVITERVVVAERSLKVAATVLF